MIIILTNFAYAMFGGLSAIVLMVIGYKVLDRFTPYDTGKQLTAGNQAVGRVVAATLVSIGIAVGLVVGLGLN